MSRLRGPRIVTGAAQVDTLLGQLYDDPAAVPIKWGVKPMHADYPVIVLTVHLAGKDEAGNLLGVVSCVRKRDWNGICLRAQEAGFTLDHTLFADEPDLSFLLETP